MIKNQQELDRKLSLPYTKLDLGMGLNIHEKEDETWIRHDGDPTQFADIVCDWDNLPLPDNSIDEIHTSDTIEHVKTWTYDITFKEWNRILKIGGILWGTTPNRDYIIKAAYGKLENEDWIQHNLYGHGLGFNHTHYTTFTKDKLRSVLEKYGFEVEFDPIEWWIKFTAKKVTNL